MPVRVKLRRLYRKSTARKGTRQALEDTLHALALGAEREETQLAAAVRLPDILAGAPLVRTDASTELSADDDTV